MMATAPSIDARAQVSASLESPLEPSEGNHDVFGATIVNGVASNEDVDIENKHITNVEDQFNSTDVSVSGGSDTDVSRAEGSRLKHEEKSHGRTASSVKKPTTFKAVSVNKTFLASKAGSTSVSPKPSEKALAGSSTPPPGSSTPTAPRPRLVAKTGGASGSVPRFSPLNGGKPAAAPDPSAVWNKNRPPEPKKFTDEELKKYGIHMASRLNESDTAGQNKWADIDDDDDDWAPEAITWGDGTKTALPHPDEQPIPPPGSGPVGAKERLRIKPRSPIPHENTSSSYQKMGGLGTGRGLVFKSSAPEKANLAAKPQPPSGPAKSPWVTLPPIDKASLVALEPLEAARPPPNHAMAVSDVPVPPKEIAADDFSRSNWQDGVPQGSRELYNSHSGKYEPVPDRRGSLRSDPHARHPAVLQRPHPQQSDQPAEPSSAFQTHRIHQEGPFRRRRASSNVSGGSGQYFQRPGRPSDGHMPPPELLGARRTSFASSVESPASSAIAQGPPQTSVKHHQVSAGWIPRPTPDLDNPHARQSGPSASLNGPAAPESEATRGLPLPPAPPQEDEIEYQKRLMREKTELARKRRLEDEAREESERRARIQKKLESLGPPPEKKGEKREMKEPQRPTVIQQRGRSDLISGGQTSNRETKSDAPEETPGTQVPSKSQEGSPASDRAKPADSVPRRLSQGQDARHSDIWGGNGPRPERFASWASGAPTPSRNVWGSPNNDRGLGNGTFNPDLGLLPGSSVSVVQGKTPSPIAPPTSSRLPSQGQPQAQAPIGSRASRYASQNTELASRWVTGVVESDRKIHAARSAERVERERQLAERGMTLEEAQPTIKDTWRQVQPSGEGSRRLMPPADVQTHGPTLWKASREDVVKGHEEAPSGRPGVIGSGAGSVLAWTGQAEPSQPRTSRFFPAKDIYIDSASTGDPTHPDSPSPPPPTMEDHPAYEGNTMHPHVSLPKPQPIVKLPPAMARVQPSRKELVWARPTQFRNASQIMQVSLQGRSVESTQQNWQSRINNLLNGGRVLPPKSMGVDPASKSALDHPHQQDAATVSLPGWAAPGLSSAQRTVTTKSMAEECFEEQEMGSLPQIRLPHSTPDAAWTPAPAPAKPLPKKFAVQASLVQPFYFSNEVVGVGHSMRIQFPGMKKAKVVTVPFSATRGNRGGHGRPAPRQHGPSNAQRGAKRDASSSHESHGSSIPGRGSRGGFRSRGSENWNRQSQSQPQSSVTK